MKELIMMQRGLLLLIVAFHILGGFYFTEYQTLAVNGMEQRSEVGKERSQEEFIESSPYTENQPHQIEGRAPQYQMGPALGEYLQQKQREESATVSSPSLLHSFGNGLMRFVSSLTPQHVESVNSLLRLWREHFWYSSHGECISGANHNQVNELERELKKKKEQLREAKEMTKKIEDLYNKAHSHPRKTLEDIAQAELLLREALSVSESQRETLSKVELKAMVEMITDRVQEKRKSIINLEKLRDSYAQSITSSLVTDIKTIMDKLSGEDITESQNVLNQFGKLLKESKFLNATPSVTVQEIEKGVLACVKRYEDVEKGFGSIKATLRIDHITEDNYWIELAKGVKSLKTNTNKLRKEEIDIKDLLKEGIVESDEDLVHQVNYVIQKTEYMINSAKANFNTLSDEQKRLTNLQIERIQKETALRERRSDSNERALDLSYRPDLYIRAVVMSWKYQMTGTNPKPVPLPPLPDFNDQGHANGEFSAPKDIKPPLLKFEPNDAGVSVLSPVGNVHSTAALSWTDADNFFNYYSNPKTHGPFFYKEYIGKANGASHIVIAYSLYKRFVAGHGVLVVASIKDNGPRNIQDSPGSLRVSFKNSISFNEDLDANEHAYIEFTYDKKTGQVHNDFGGSVKDTRSYGFHEDSGGFPTMKSSLALIQFLPSPCTGNKQIQKNARGSKYAIRDCKEFNLNSTKMFNLKERYNLGTVDDRKDICGYISSMQWLAMSLPGSVTQRTEEEEFSDYELTNIFSNRLTPAHVMQAYIKCEENQTCIHSRFTWDLNIFVIEPSFAMMRRIIKPYQSGCREQL
eukprot:Nk52_evm21s153 gene=Nk52_evmTU21s153